MTLAGTTHWQQASRSQRGDQMMQTGVAYSGGTYTQALGYASSLGGMSIPNDIVDAMDPNHRVEVVRRAVALGHTVTSPPSADVWRQIVQEVALTQAP